MNRRLVFSNYDSPGNPFYGGGGARAIQEVARRLARRHEVTVVTGKHPGNLPTVVDGVRYAPLGSRRAGPKLGQLLFQFLLPWRVARGDFDLWVESLTPPFSTACLPLFTRKPVVALTQVLAGAAMTRKYKLPFGAVERLGLRTYRYAIVLSSHLQSVVEQANPRLCSIVIPNGVGRELIDQPVAHEEAHVLYLGRLDVEQKGLDLLLEAVQSVAARLALPVLVAGAGPSGDTAFVSRRVRELGLEGRVRLLGRVGDAEKADLLRRTAVLLMPSRFEASPLVLMEAFCHAVPVVLFDIPELSDFPETCCVKVPPFDSRALGEALLALLGDPARRNALGRAAKEFARRFDWDELATQYENFFERILNNLDPPRRRL